MMNFRFYYSFNDMIVNSGIRRIQYVFDPAKLMLKLSTGKPGTYVLDSSAAREFHMKFAVALSNYVVKLYDVNGTLLEDYVHERDITQIKFSRNNPPCLFTSSLDGKIVVWDDRCQGPVQTFMDDSDGALKPLLCFDYSSDENTLCAGTEVIREDAFLVFWDRRTSRCMGGYWNSHTEDITDVQFHPENEACVASSSADGLINIYNINKRTEADALKYTLNAEAGISKFCWRAKDLACLTSIEQYQIWSKRGAYPTFCVSKERMTTKSQIKVDRMIENLKTHGFWCLATGNYEGGVHLWKYVDRDLKPLASLLEGHSDVVRTICNYFGDNIILTGGEDGGVCLWKVPPE